MSLRQLARRIFSGRLRADCSLNCEELIEALRPWPRPPLARAGIRPGVYHYLREKEGAFTRFHLRVDSTGGGLLLANASAAARLHASGIIIAKGLLEDKPGPVLVDQLVRFFRGVTVEQAAGDVERVRQVIATLDAPGDNFPILNLSDPSFCPEAAPLDKPLSADVSLAPRQKTMPILNQLWELGIPHVTFVVGEHPDSAALIGAVERTEDLGMIAGVRARGSDLAGGTLIKDLATVGVDHVDVLYLSADAAVHDGLAGSGDHDKAVRIWETAQDNEVCPVAVVPLVEATLETIEETIEELASLEVGNVCYYAIASDGQDAAAGAVAAEALIQAAQLIEDAAEESQVRYLWFPPVKRAVGRSLAEQVCRGPRTSGDQAIRVEPDGAVFVARGPFQPVGNLLTDAWETIREHEVYREYRRRIETDTHCEECPGLATCAADCPRNPAGWAEAMLSQ